MDAVDELLKLADQLEQLAAQRVQLNNRGAAQLMREQAERITHPAR